MKIGIITYYYESVNYGGVLQAYALCECLNSIGFDCEQICFDYKTHSHTVIAKLKQTVMNLLFRKRYAKFAEFRNRCPHSKNIYVKNDIKDTLNVYDIFIVGSDQVWNFDWFIPEFFLDFVGKDKTKIAYAVSLGKSRLNEEQINYLKNTIKSFNAISVREKDSVELVQPFCEKDVKFVLDPTLLMPTIFWNQLCSDRCVDGDYIYCHFIGDNKNDRKIAKELSKKTGYKIISLHHPSRLNKFDYSFGDKGFGQVGPCEFLSFIKYARIVLTDSFHCCVFSTIFNKQFFVFPRFGSSGMSSRIYTLTELLCAEDRFCDTDEKKDIQYLVTRKKIDYKKSKETIENLKFESLDFLHKAIMEKME